MMNNELLTIGKLAQITGLSTYTLRFYEDAGLLPNVQRLPNGQRRYSVWHITWLEFVIRMRATQMPIPEIRRYAELLVQGVETTEERLTLLETHEAFLECELTVLERNLQALKEKIAVYRALYMPQSARPHNPWRLHLDEARPIARLAQLPVVIERFLAVRDFASGLEFLGQTDYSWFWAEKYRFLAEMCIWYQAFPDYDWGIQALWQQDKVIAIEVAPQGTHTAPFVFNGNGQAVEIVATSLPLPLKAGTLLVREQDGIIVELVSEFPQSLTVSIQTFIDTHSFVQKG
jgi:DNA-binding transcriptional MerR regulator